MPNERAGSRLAEIQSVKVAESEGFRRVQLRRQGRGYQVWRPILVRLEQKVTA
jgi:hypothetical protein